MVGYNAAKSDLPILAEHGLDYSQQYKVDLYDEAFWTSEFGFTWYCQSQIANCCLIFLDFKVSLIIA